MKARGGQIWSQKAFPFMKRYVSIVPKHPDLMILMSDPRQQGSTICTEEDGQWSYTPEGLQERLKAFKYTCDGQLADLLREERVGQV